MGRLRSSFGTDTAPTTNTTPTVSIAGTPGIGNTLTATATGFPTPTYQWTRNGVNIAAATSSTYVQVAADITKAIRCVVTSAAGTATSNAITYTLAGDSNILDGVQGSQYVSGTNWPTIMGIGTATLASASHVTASTLSGLAAMHADGDASAYVTISGLDTALSTQSGASVFALLKTNQPSLAALWEYRSGSDMNVTLHDSGVGEAIPAATYWSFWSTPDSDTAAQYWSYHFDRTVSSGIAGVRAGGSAVSLSQHGTPATPGGTFGSGNLVLFNRNDHAIPCIGDIAIFVVTKSALSPTGNAALTIEAALKNLAGL